MIYTVILLFFIYSILGWIMEVLVSLFREKRFINRGFLLGPYCPIYGVGCTLLNFLLHDYIDDTLVLFALTFLVCSILEYFTSWIMEKIFKLRWWDYTRMKFNINGRICLETMLPFSLIGVLVVKYANPFLVSIIDNTNQYVLVILCVILIAIFVCDIMVSTNVIFNLKTATLNMRKDSTEEIRKAVEKAINNNKFMYERIIKAFPNMTKIIDEQRKKTKEFIDKQSKKIKKKINK